MSSSKLEAAEAEINAQVVAVADYLEWVERQPFGAPTDINVYREHLEIEVLRG